MPRAMTITGSAVRRPEAGGQILGPETRSLAPATAVEHRKGEVSFQGSAAPPRPVPTRCFPRGA